MEHRKNGIRDKRWIAGERQRIGGIYGDNGLHRCRGLRLHDGEIILDLVFIDSVVHAELLSRSSGVKLEEKKTAARYWSKGLISALPSKSGLAGGICLSEHDGGMKIRVIIVEDMEASVRVEVDGSVMPAPLDPHVPALAVKVHLTEELTFRISDLLSFFRHIVILSRGAGEVIRLVRLGWSRELCWPGRACSPCLAQL